jgi:hypothetical protein
VIHKRCRTAEEECALADFTKALDDELTTEVARRACPTALRSGKDEYMLKVGETLLKALQLLLEDNVPLRAHGVEKSGLRIQAEVIYVPEYRHDRRDPATGGEKDNTLVPMLVETESTQWPRSLHSQAIWSAFIQESRNATFGVFLR